jgi:hypothetical protein
VRAAIRARSLRLTPPAQVQPVGEKPQMTSLQRRIQLGHFTSESVKAMKRACYTLSDPTPPDRRHKTRQRKLKLVEIIDIVHRVMVGKYKLADVALFYGVSTPTVSRHVGATRKRPLLLRELLSKQREKSAIRAQIGDQVQAKVDGREILDSAAKVAADIQSPETGPISTTEMRSIMRLDLGMRDRKIVAISPSENTM